MNNTEYCSWLLMDGGLVDLHVHNAYESYCVCIFLFKFFFF